MNILLLEKKQLTGDSATLNQRQQEHLRNVLKVTSGDEVSVGIVNGKLGRAKIIHNSDEWELNDIRLNAEPPEQRNLTLLLAMPRPQMLKRIIQTAATFGVKRICLMQTHRVEKSFWQSPSATDVALREQLILGLEQARATQLPTIEKHMRFKPFLQDSLPQMLAQENKELNQPVQQWLAHPGDYPHFDNLQDNSPIFLAIGPEGGFINHEIELFSQQGFSIRQMGARILRVETAVISLLGKLYL